MGPCEQIFTHGVPFRSCHASTVVALPGDTRLAAWFGGRFEGAEDVAIWASRREAGTWSTPVRVARIAETAHWNPVLFRGPDGRIHLWFKVGPRIDSWITCVITSDDDGLTWTSPCELVPGDVGGRGPVRNKPIVLADGAWLAGASTEIDYEWRVFTDRSEDAGRTWQRSPYVPAFDKAHAIQPTLWESSPGHVHMLTRSRCGSVLRSDSPDGGRTWSPLERTDLPNNNSAIDLVRLDDGVLVLALNPVRGDWGAARTPLSLVTSDDDGRSWTHCLNLAEGPEPYDYPAVIRDGDGVAVTWSMHRDSIAFQRLSRADLSA